VRRRHPPAPSLRRPLCCPPPVTLRLHPSRAARGDHHCEPPQGMHGHGYHTWQSAMPQQTAGPRRGGHTGCRPPRRSSCYLAGLVFRLAGISTIAADAAKNKPGNRFPPTPQGSFCTPQASSSFTASSGAVYATTAETVYENRTPCPLLPQGQCLWRLPMRLVLSQF
jgi:hypothetical protein